jgi:hypothetical protein
LCKLPLLVSTNQSPCKHRHLNIHFVKQHCLDRADLPSLALSTTRR